MPCPTCDHTLATITSAEGMCYRRCDRCGTIVVSLIDPAEASKYEASFPRVYAPKLVFRCRKFISVIGATVPNPHLAAVNTEWHRIGIAEAINKPEDRP